jgi:hypothetical protein
MPVLIFEEGVIKVIPWMEHWQVLKLRFAEF